MKRPSLKLRREALLALCKVVGANTETQAVIRDATHSDCDRIERALLDALLRLGFDIAALNAAGGASSPCHSPGVPNDVYVQDGKFYSSPGREWTPPCD